MSDQDQRGSLGVGDWVTFLSSEKDISGNVIIGFAALFISVVGILAATPLEWLEKTIIYIVVFGLGYVSFNEKIIKPYQRRRMDAGILLREIMTGKLNDPKQIQEKWIAILTQREEKMPKKKGWTVYSIAIFVVGLLLLAEGFVDLLGNQLPNVLSKGWWYVIFAVVFFLVAFIGRTDEHP